MNFIESWYFLELHPIFDGRFQSCLDIEIVKVNPVTGMFEDVPSLNTRVRVWLECGPYSEPTRTHDPSLDCGGWTFEEAICTLAKLVRESYGPSARGWKKLLRRYADDSDGFS